jgi:hypothetical protein
MWIKAAVLSLATAAITGMTGTAYAVTVQKATFKNTQLSLFSFLETSVTCADTSQGTATAFVFLSGGSFVDPFGSGTGTLLTVFSFSNSCTGDFFGEANGFIQGGVTGPNQPLTSARLTGSTTGQVFDEPDRLVSLGLDLTFTGDGDISVSRDTTQTKTVTGPGGPFTITIQRGAFRNRSAIAAGTITIQGVVFPVETFGTLLDNKSSTITVTK